MKNCQANALNQERKPRTNEREPHVALRNYRRNLANTNVHSRVCYVRLREPACWPGPNPKDDLQSPGEVEVMINCQAIALNQERKPRTNEREPHVAPRN